MSRSCANVCLYLGLLAPSCVHRESPSTSRPSTFRYQVLIADRLAGSQISELSSKGEWQISYEFNDRGRGPRLTTKLRLRSDGTPSFIETAGHNYLKAKVDDRFWTEGPRAIWRNGIESGEKQNSGNAFYVSANSAPEELALLASALLATPDKKLALLPQGEARI
jgi:hypothetical protein